MYVDTVSAVDTGVAQTIVYESGVVGFRRGGVGDYVWAIVVGVVVGRVVGAFGVLCAGVEKGVCCCLGGVEGVG